jgi:hypothetical protein
VATDCCARQFSFKHLLQIVFVVLVLEVEAVFAVHSTVNVEVLFDVQRLCNLIVTSYPVVEAVAVFPHDVEDSVLLCVWGSAVNL